MLNVRKGIDVFNDAMKEIMNPVPGIPLPKWKKLNDLLGGLRLHEFTIFCGATGAGKTQWLAALITQIVKQEINTFIAAVETGDTDFAKRMLSGESGKDLNTGEKFGYDDFASAMRENMEAFGEYSWFSTHENRIEINEMIETLKYMVEVHNVKVAVLDNFNFFLKPSSANQQILVADEALHEFVILAKKVPIHIILVMHPKKTDGGKLTSEHDIKGSSTSVQECSNCLLMNRPSEDEIDAGINPLCREFFFTKIRKRGFNVGRRFYLEYRGGGYHDPIPAGKVAAAGYNKIRAGSEARLPNDD